MGYLRRLLLSLVLTTAFALLCAAAITRGQAEPPSEWVSVMRLDTCSLPCWLGIYAGKTTVNDAQIAIERAFGDPTRFGVQRQDFGDYWTVYDVRYLDSGYRMEILLSSIEDGRVVDGVDFGFHRSSRFRSAGPTLPDIIPALGDPEAVQTRANAAAPQETVVWFREGTVAVRMGNLDCGRVRVDTPLQSISLAPTIWDYRDASAWRGFRVCTLEPVTR